MDVVAENMVDELLGTEEIVDDHNILTDDVEPDDPENKNIEQAVIEKINRFVRFPLTRIKSIIKADSDVNLASHDAVVLIAKATVIVLATILN